MSATALTASNWNFLIMTERHIAQQLLAKSYDRLRYPTAPPAYALLTQHTRDVVDACVAIVSIIGRQALTNAGLDVGLFDGLCRITRANAWIQDLGKANSHTQEMLTSNPQIHQLLRHEVLSGLLVWFEPGLRKWLSPLAESLTVAVWGAMGHHRKFDERSRPGQSSPENVYLSHPNVRTILSMMADDLVLEMPPVFTEDLVVGRTSRDQCDVAAQNVIDQLIGEFEDLEAGFEDPLKRRVVALVKGIGIAADVAASACGPYIERGTIPSVTEFIRQNLGGVGLGECDFSALINQWAWEHCDCCVEQIDLNVLPPGFVIRPFQTAVAASKAYLTLATAGCGSGKSLAAYLWGQTWCDRLARDGVNNFRFMVCLPTTGTATEHFKDYALESGINASLSHSRARVDLSTIAETAQQEEAEGDAAAAARAVLNSERDKIDSLRLWGTPLVVATADTVLGLMANARRGIYGLPAIMSSAIVFDEIHAYDDQMFGHLLMFLKHFPRLPVLLMTASLPQSRLRALQAVRRDLHVEPGPTDYELLERYAFIPATDKQSVADAIRSCLNDNGKVLWVRNRVEWANETYRECRTQFRQSYVNVYHSRLRYKDRSRRHRQVIDHFRKAGQPAILVATQVAEMSLDLSADLLITDVAPVPALIQRLGRLNRRSTPEEKQPPKPAFIQSLPSESGNPFLPYEKEEINIAASWIESLLKLSRPLNQTDLAQAFERFCQQGDFNLDAAEEKASFIGVPGKSGLWRTRPGFVRDAGYTVSVVLEADLETCSEWNRHGDPNSDWLRRHEVSIPIREPVFSWQSVAGVRVAPRDAILYDFDETTLEGTGAKWKSH